MSRKSRSKPLIGKRSPDGLHVKKYSRREVLQYLIRRWRRSLIEEGKIATGDDAPKKYRFVWELGEDRGVVTGQNQIEARIQIKKILGIKPSHRIPQGLKIAKFNNTTTSPVPKKT